MFIIKFCLWLDLNRGPLVLEVTSLPQPLPSWRQPMFRHKTHKHNYLVFLNEKCRYTSLYSNCCFIFLINNLLIFYKNVIQKAQKSNHYILLQMLVLKVSWPITQLCYSGGGESSSQTCTFSLFDPCHGILSQVINSLFLKNVIANFRQRFSVYTLMHLIWISNFHWFWKIAWSRFRNILQPSQLIFVCL